MTKESALFAHHSPFLMQGLQSHQREVGLEFARGTYSARGVWNKRDNLARRYFLRKRMKITALGVLKPRSSALKEIDSAIKEYWKQTAPASRRKGMSGIRLALENWIREKGPNWRNSERNKAPHRIVSELYWTVTERPAFTPDELAAFRWQDEQRRFRLGQIFAGKEIVWSAFNNTKDTQAALAAARLAAKGGIPKTHQSDVEAIKKFKDEQNALIQDLRIMAKDLAMPCGKFSTKARSRAWESGDWFKKALDRTAANTISE